MSQQHANKSKSKGQHYLSVEFAQVSIILCKRTFFKLMFYIRWQVHCTRTLSETFTTRLSMDA